MKERPILFSGAMVRAILDGKKTQTRRVMKLTDSGRVACGGRNWHLDDPNATMACPYGQPGDQLWVREAWGTVQMHELGQHVFGSVRVADSHWVAYKGGRKMGIPVPGTRPIEFKAEWRDDLTPPRWRPSIHMPRWASRITLELTDVRVQRVQEISPADCHAEGLERASKDGRLHKWGCDAMAWTDWRISEIDAFQGLWDSLNTKRGFGWESNPFVWALTFKRVEAES